MLDEMDWIRSEFPIVEKMVYLDMAYGNPLSTSVLKAIEKYLEDFQRYGVSVARTKAYKVLEEVRNRFAALVAAESSEIAFVKNTSEGLNIAANGIPFTKGDKVVLNELEHPNNTHCWHKIKAKGVKVETVPQKSGRVDIEDLTSAIDANTKAVAVASTTNMGFRFDLKELGKICEENDALLVVDAVQSLGIEPLDVKKVGIDIFSSSAHKGLLGPHGIGFLYCSKEALREVEPTYVAGISFEKNSSGEAQLKNSAAKFEFGNYNYLGGHAMVPALSILEKISIEKIKEHCFYLADNFREGISDLGVEILDSQFSSERSQIVAFKVKGIDSGIAQTKLLDNGVMMSAHYGDLRASFSLFNTLNEVKKAVEIIKEVK